MKMNTSFPVYFDKRGGLAGAVFGGTAFAVCAIWYSWKIGLLFAVLFLATGFIKLRLRHPVARFLVNGVWGIVCIVASCVFPSLMVSEESYLILGHFRIVMNFVCVAVVYGICLTVTGEIKPAVAVASGLLLVMATVNAFLFQFRGNELKPLDFLSVQTALNVVDQYAFRIQPEMLYSWLLWLWMMFCLHALPPADQLLPKGWFRLAAAAATVLCAVLLCSNTGDVRTKNWSNQGTTYNGYFLNFFTGLRDSIVRKPEDYSSEAVEALASDYDAPSASTAGKSLPNIVVIMNESFADVTVLGSELRTNQPVTPFVDALRENTIRGHALVSIFGGTTANSECEFLTGSSMAYLPEGSVPYQQYITGNLYSLPWLMASYGYRTLATHPYDASGWNRTAVYPSFGFSESTFSDAYPWENLVREYVSDREMYAYVLERLAEPSEQPLFLFGITMQNHGDYIYTGDNYAQTIYLEGYAQEYPMAEQYLTLLHESDKAVEYLLTELADFPEDTIVLFFGDHFPKVEEEFFQEVHGGAFETLPEQMLQYQVPFFLWANYDIQEQTVECASLNYLGRYLLEAAGLELPPYYRFLKDLEEAVPAVNALGYYSVSQQTFLPLEDAAGEEAQWLSRYSMAQYNNLFDGDNRSPVFFQRYLPAAAG